jgi:hypothetical protein
MALSKTVVKQAWGQDLSIPNVYIKVNQIKASKELAEATITYSVDGEVKETKGIVFNVDVADGSVNFIKQAYEHLKTLPEFSGATDC